MADPAADSPKPSFLRLALTIGAMSAIGPVAVDMYLPGLPSIARDLRASEGGAEATMLVFFLGMTAGQLFYGPLSDRTGRKPPLLFALALFVIGSLACSVATSLPMLLAARLVQALGAAAGQSIGSAAIRDLHTGYQAARLQATRLLVLGVSPILAPIVGAAFVAAGSWRAVFWTLAALGVACIVLVATLFPETRPREARGETKMLASFAVYGSLLANTHLRMIAVTLGFAWGAFYAYIAGSAFVIIELNHASPAVYSGLFAGVAVAFIGSAQFSPQLMRRFGAERVILTGLAILVIGSLSLLAVALAGQARIPVLAPIFFFTMGSLGLIGGPATILALRDHGPVAGAAASLTGFIQGIVGASGAALVSLFANGSALPMTGVMAVYSVLALGVAVTVLGPRARAPA